MNEATLALVADKFGTTVERLWGVVLKQAPVEGASMALMLTVSTLATIAFACFARRKFIQFEGTYREGDGWLLVALASAVALLNAAILFLFVPKVLAAFFNPEYWVLMQVLR